MGLSVSLRVETPVSKKGTGVFIREGGKNKELSIEEVKEKFPDATIEEQEYETDIVFHSNITHNLNGMAMEAGIYNACWRPEELDIKFAKQLILPLETGIGILEEDPEHFRKYDSENGWGTYDDFLPWVKEYLEACKKYPDSIIGVSR